jgi:DNA-binding beta-propeller fold protein YncE
MRFFPAVLGLMLVSGSLNAQGVTVAVAGTDIDVDLYGTVYVLDAPSSTLRLLNTHLQSTAVTGGPGWENGRFDQPSAVWARNGLDIFVADYGNHRIQRFDRQLAFVSSLSTRDGDSPDQRFGYPTDVALSRLGELFICDGENQRVVKVNGQSQVVKAFGGFDAGRGKLEKPTRLAIGPSDYVYVLDGSRILVFDSFGNFLRELYENIWKHPSAIFADETRVLVADQGALYCFDHQERPAGKVSFSGFAPTVKGEVRSIGAQDGKLYLLDEAGLTVADDPCTPGDRIDK